MKLAAALVCCVSLVGGVARGGQQRWTLSTDDTRIAIAVVGERPVIESLQAAGAAHDWAGEDAALPLLAQAWLDGVSQSVHWKFQRARLDEAQGKLTLSFASAEPPLVLRSIWQARPGAGPVRHWVEIDNLAERPVTVGHQESLALAGLRPGGAANWWWIRRGGGNASQQGGTYTVPMTANAELTLASNCDDGASPVPWLAVQVGNERGLYVGWEFSGLGRVAATSGDGQRLNIAVGNHPEFRTDIAPHATLHIPPALVGCYRGDVEEGSYRLHRFIIEKLRPKVPAGFADPTLAYNLFLDSGGTPGNEGNVERSTTEADVLRCAQFCHELGFETFVPDAMWFPHVGDWRWDPARFPRGIEPLAALLHDRGLKLGLWCAWTNGGLSTDPAALAIRGPVARPEWFTADVPADWKPGPFYGARICLGCAEAQAWAVEKTQWLVSQYRLDYLKHDIGPIATACSRTTHRHRHGVDASYWATLGYYDVHEQLLARFDHLVLENCSGGGHIKDFGVIQRSHYTVTTDTLSNLPDRQSIYDSTYAFPPLVLQAYTYDNYYPVRGDEPGPMLWRSAMMGAWQIDPTDTLTWTEQQRQSAQRAVEVYRTWIRPLLVDVRVHHILPRPDGVHWDGMFYFSPSQRRGTAFIFRPDSPEPQQTVRLAGLNPAGQYWVWSEDGSVAAGRRSGAELLGDGLGIALPAPYTSELVFVQDAELGEPAGLAPPGEFALQAAQVNGEEPAAEVALAWRKSENARGYRVVVARDREFADVLAETTTQSTAARFGHLPPQAELYWRVVASGWGGQRTSAPAQFTTPPPGELRGAAFVSDMHWLAATAGAGNPVRRDKNLYGRPLSIGGHAHAKGLWTHAFDDAAPADVVVDLAGRNIGTFAADAGLDDAAGGSVQFQVLVDGELRDESPVLRPKAVHRFRVDLTGGKRLTLRVLNGGDGYASDHAAWGSARLIAAGSADPLEQ